MVSARPRGPATYADLEALPEGVVGELLDGELHAQPRPANRHAKVSSRLAMAIGGSFDMRRRDASGWIILHEPELHLGTDVLVPDLAGWRRSRMPEVPDAAAFELAPDWVCEVTSPSTRRVDTLIKRPIYARERVGHLWIVDPAAQVIEVFRSQGDRWTLVAAVGADALVALEPFEAEPLDLGYLWGA